MWCGTWAMAACCVAAAATLCDISVGNRTYSEVTLVSEVGSPFGLAVDYSTDSLYFNYIRNPILYSAKVNLKSKEFTAIEELSGRCRFAVDRARGYVHAGCNVDHGAGGGLYQWDSHPAMFVPEGETGRAVRFVEYNNKTLYYSLVRDGILRTFVRGHSAVVPGFSSDVHGLVFEDQGDWIFYNRTGIYRREGAGATQFAEYEDLSAIALDRHGALYACGVRGPVGVWRLGGRAAGATELLAAPCTGLTFGADDSIIYGDYSNVRVVRLVPC